MTSNLTTDGFKDKTIIDEGVPEGHILYYKLMYQGYKARLKEESLKSTNYRIACEKWKGNASYLAGLLLEKDKTIHDLKAKYSTDMTSDQMEQKNAQIRKLSAENADLVTLVNALTAQRHKLNTQLQAQNSSCEEAWDRIREIMEALND
jgi:cell division protein FtsB